MWVHRSGELYTQRPIVVFVTDGLSQYHLVDIKLPDVTNANCWAHARRDYADAGKAADKGNPASLENSIAHQALERIAKFYEEDGKLKDLPPEERLPGEVV